MAIFKMKIKILLITIALAVIPALLFGHGWIGVSPKWQAIIALLIGIIGVLTGTLCFQIPLLMRLQKHISVIIICGFISCILAMNFSYMFGVNAWSWFKINGDFEAYLWGVFLASIVSGIIAIPFGIGLIKSMLTKNQ